MKCLNLMRGGVVYNIGMSGHRFLNCYQNLASALQKYKPTKYVIIETSNITFSEKSIKSALNNSIPEINSRSEGILAKLSENPFLRLLYKQLKEFSGQKDDSSEENEISNFFDYDLYNQLLSNIAEEASKYDIKPIIMYHPTTAINSDGSLQLPEELTYIDEFKSICEKNGIILVDMTDRFKKEFYYNHLLPYGFSNSSIGSGHLNEYGHKMIAEELYKVIKGGE